MAFDFGKFSAVRMAAVSAVSVIAGLLMSSVSMAADFEGAPATQEPFFDELRFGAQIAVDKTRTNDERGSFYQVTMFFDPFNNDTAVGWKEHILRPRVYVGGTVASDSREASMLFTGLAWNANITEKAFLELGFGGMIHNGDLDYDGTRGPKLGCRTLFREYAAIGYDVTQNWRVLAQVEHSSHANLCGDTNNGLTRAGLAVGYKF
ncbi:MAG: hypothetical protein BGN83_09030 [Rhizobium sp. 63-7]|nr:MAG: hypothetical protein BGN83_09030 [Rhizobium sp. 63-7]